MSQLFLATNAIDLPFNWFKNGMLNLVAIEKRDTHTFYKNEEVYFISAYEHLVTTYGQEEQEISRFIEQLSPCESNVNDEVQINAFCGCTVNGFLGIDFSPLSIPNYKRVACSIDYRGWIYYFANNLEKLQIEVKGSILSANFIKDFNSLSNNVQISIIEEFKKAKARGLFTPYYPDTKIIKDVTGRNHRHKVLELRVYAPLALRVYFNETGEDVFLASIDQKSNPNQTADINAAHQILEGMI